jgi:flagellar biosynthesis protein FliR
MIAISSAQLDAWLAALMFPMARILALLATAPVFNNPSLPTRLRLIAGLAIGFALAPALPPMPTVPAGSWIGLVILGQEVLIGVLMGVTLRIVFAAVDLAGELIAMQMSLSFAVAYDPQSAGQTPVISEFLGLITILTFLAVDGHLMIVAALAESFNLVPVSATPIHTAGIGALLSWSAALFSAGLLLALPIVGALLIANISLGVLTKVAPQMNLFSVGFVITIVAGFIMLKLTLPNFVATVERLFDQGFSSLQYVLKAMAG